MRQNEDFLLAGVGDDMQMMHLKHRDAFSHWNATVGRHHEFNVPLGLVSSVKSHQHPNVKKHNSIQSHAFDAAKRKIALKR